MNQAGLIRVLPPLLVNKIAAGEVIERPASVVKELLDNALDAGASRIAVTIEQGGRDFIRVSDDGSGMSRDDLRLAVTAHATSKLASEEDLYNVTTMGFRGEALASISAVAKLHVTSRTRGAVEGFEIRATGEKIEPVQPAACAEGTAVSVRDLFFNVPARRKFLRSPSAESGHINEQITRAALANPHITFEVRNNKRTTLNFPSAKDRRQRVARVYSPELAEALLHVERDERGLHLEAYVAPPVHSRATAQWQYTFVNGRYIRDRFLQHAIKEAHRGLMEPNRHGVVFLFLTLDPHDIDVNVHPTKLEVRWADSGLIHSQVLSALRETFQRADLTPALRTDRARPPVDEREQERIRAEFATMLKSAAPLGRTGSTFSAEPASGGGVPHTSSASAPAATGFHTDRTGPGGDVDAERMWRALYGPGPTSGAAAQRSAGDQSTTSSTRRSEPSGEANPASPSGPAYGGRAVQMHNLYLVAETDDGIVIVDQHALHERVMFEHLRRRIASGTLESQRLLLPETLNVTADQVELLEANGELLERLGIEVTPFGSGSIAVHAIPSILKDTQVVGFLRDLLDKLGGHDGGTTSDVMINDVLAMMACKAAVKAGDALNPEEIDALMAQRHLLDQPSACPHGRPTSLRLTKADLNRQFHRT